MVLHPDEAFRIAVSDHPVPPTRIEGECCFPVRLEPGDTAHYDIVDGVGHFLKIVPATARQAAMTRCLSAIARLNAEAEREPGFRRRDEQYSLQYTFQHGWSVQQNFYVQHKAPEWYGPESMRELLKDPQHLADMALLWGIEQ